jgi:hypothetical protein
MLWALAAGRCSFPACNELCVALRDDGTSAAATGDVAHIVSHSRGGPRADPSVSASDADSYANWILLCASHHRLVDARPATYDADTLRRFKQAHEAWVRTTLQTAIDAPSPAHASAPQQLMLFRVGPRDRPLWEAPPTIGRVSPPLGRWDDPALQYSVRYATNSLLSALTERFAFLRSVGVDPKHLLPMAWGVANVSGRFARLEDPVVQALLGHLRSRLAGGATVELSRTADTRLSQEASRILYDTGAWDGVDAPSRWTSGARVYALFDSAHVEAGTLHFLAPEDPYVGMARRELSRM